jgi:hypothetical protein
LVLEAEEELSDEPEVERGDVEEADDELSEDDEVDSLAGVAAPEDFEVELLERLSVL